MGDSNHSNNHYNPRLQPNASKLRKTMTKGEACLWKYVLRAGMMKGYTFRRQRPVLRFIADFMCQELMLIIEVDGLTHDWEETVAKDGQRDLELKNAGYTILRFNNSEVLNNIYFVREQIAQWIELQEVKGKR